MATSSIIKEVEIKNGKRFVEALEEALHIASVEAICEQHLEQVSEIIERFSAHEKLHNQMKQVDIKKHTNGAES